jgi:cytochrome c553
MSAARADPLERESLEARFFDVICDDEELLAAEFEAIVSAGWRSTLPTRPGGQDLRGSQAGSQARGGTAPCAGCHESTGVPARARQRSPPREGRRIDTLSETASHGIA